MTIEMTKDILAKLQALRKSCLSLLVTDKLPENITMVRKKQKRQYE